VVDGGVNAPEDSDEVTDEKLEVKAAAFVELDDDSDEATDEKLEVEVADFVELDRIDVIELERIGTPAGVEDDVGVGVDMVELRGSEN
jgi:hypothetical protein